MIEIITHLGKTLDCLIAEVILFRKKGKSGYTVKDINNDNPDMFVWCLENKEKDDDKVMIFDLNNIHDLIRVKGAFKLSDFQNSNSIWKNTGRLSACIFS
jgi:hypothetical protein